MEHLTTMKHFALATRMVRERARIERLFTEVRQDVNQQVWEEIRQHVRFVGTTHVRIKLPRHHEIDASYKGEWSGAIVYTVHHPDSDREFSSIEDAFVCADADLQRKLKKEARREWPLWKWLLWTISFTLAEIP